MSYPHLKQASLREVAEERLDDRPPVESSQANDSALTLMHELQAHKIELEMQNQTLLQANAALEESHDRYLDLYDYSPVGYLTLTRDGSIAEINLTGTALLGSTKRPIDQVFAAFLAPEETYRWHQFFSDLIPRGGQAVAEFKLIPINDKAVHVRIEPCIVRNRTG